MRKGVEDINKAKRGEDIDEEEEDRDFNTDEGAIYDIATVIFDRKGKKILFGDKDEDNDEDSDYLLDEEDDRIGNIEQYEVEVTKDKDHYGADREAGKETPVGSEAAESPDRGDGDSKSTEVREPIELNERKGGDLERMKGYFEILQMLWSLTTSTLNHSTR